MGGDQKAVVIGIDVGYEESSVCVLNTYSAEYDQFTVDTSIANFLNIIRDVRAPIKVVGFETGSLSYYLATKLLGAGLPTLVVDARRAAPTLRSIKAAKTDANDAYAIAELIRREAYSRTWVKSAESTQILALLTFRNALIKCDLILRGTILSHIRSSGEKFKPSKRKQYISEIKAHIAASGDTQTLPVPLKIIEQIDQELYRLDKEIDEIARSSETCQLLMTVPGIGPKTAVLYRAVIDDPHRFVRSRNVGPFLGLSPNIRQSGRIRRMGPVTKVGPKELRQALYMAAMTLLYTVKYETPIRRWGFRIAGRRGKKKAFVAVARKLAVVMHSVWRNGQPYQPGGFQ